jgi:hypothetical protein
LVDLSTIHCQGLYSEYILKYPVAMSIALSHIQSSDLSRNPLKVFTAAEAGPVLVTRRDGENFLIMTESEAESRQTLQKFAGMYFEVAQDERGGTLTERMIRQFPWIAAFDASGQDDCVRALVGTAKVAFATGQSLMFEIEYNSWYDSAEAMAAGLHLVNRDWTEEPILATSPA